MTSAASYNKNKNKSKSKSKTRKNKQQRTSTRENYYENENRGVYNGVNDSHNHCNNNNNNNSISNQNAETGVGHKFLQLFQTKTKTKQALSEQTITTDTQLLLNQFASATQILDRFVQLLESEGADKNLVSCENTLAITSMNIFNAMCNSQLRKNNVRGVHLVSYKLAEYVQTLDGKQRQILDPFINYAVCAVQGLKPPLLESIQVSRKDWKKTAQPFMTGVLGSGHVISEQVQAYNQQTAPLNSKFEKKWTLNNQKVAQFGQKGQIASAKQMSQQMHQNSDTTNVSLGYGYLEQNQSQSQRQNHQNVNVSGYNNYRTAPVSVQLECYGDDDDSDSDFAIQDK